MSSDDWFGPRPTVRPTAPAQPEPMQEEREPRGPHNGHGKHGLPISVASWRRLMTTEGQRYAGTHRRQF